MVLTEPQAGSDLGQVRTRAVPEGDHYRLFGQKIFITWGDHDLTDNTIHMVLARIDGAPAGVKGISLFIVPKVLVNDDGSLGARNDVRCLSIEHKLGIHASPTCVLAFGERAGAVGYLVGEPGRGLEYMFIMMNSARLSVGSEGYAVGERAFQRALDWARTRVQGRPPVMSPGAGPAPIINHPDVKRMLLMMKSQTEASRALTLLRRLAVRPRRIRHRPAWARSRAGARRAPDAHRQGLVHRDRQRGRAPSACRCTAAWVSSRRPGAAQYVRDVRITTIYEGTTGIQSNDLLGRKLGKDHGAAMAALLADARRELEALPVTDAAAEAARGAALEALERLAHATQALLRALATRTDLALAVSVPYLKLCGYVLGGWLLAKSAALAQAGTAGAERDFYRAKIRTAAFYAAQVLPLSGALAQVVENGAASVTDTDAALI